MACHASGLETASDEDGTDSLLSAEDELLDIKVQERRTRRNIFATVVGSALVATAIYATRSTIASTPAPLTFDASADNLIQESSECGGPFEQCGGSDFSGATCCQAGCVCQPKNRYFSKCQPATHSTQCDPAAAQKKADSILKAAIPYQAKAYEDSKKKATAARKAADLAEKLAESETKASELADAEERAATKAFHAIQLGNGEKWVEHVYQQGGIAKKAQAASDQAAADFSALEDAEAARDTAASNLIHALPKAEKLAGPEKLWADNLADDAVWTPIGDNFKRLPDDTGVDKKEDEGSTDKSSTGGGDSKLVGGVYYTR